MNDAEFKDEITTILSSHNYKITNYLGEGHYSNSFLIVNNDTGKLYSAKIYNYKLSCKNMGCSFDQFSDGIKKKISIMKSLIFVDELIKCYNGLFCGNISAQISEYCGSVTLSDLLKKNDNCLNFNIVRWILRQLLTGLYDIHQMRYMHGDLHPSNIFILNNNFIIKLGDISIIGVIGSSNNNYKGNHTNVDVVNDILKASNDNRSPNHNNNNIENTNSRFSYKYIPPECFNNNYINSIYNDIWSIGVLLIDIIYGVNKLPNIHLQNDRDVATINNQLSIDKTTDIFVPFIKDCLNLNRNNRKLTKELLESDLFSDFKGIPPCKYGPNVYNLENKVVYSSPQDDLNGQNSIINELIFENNDIKKDITNLKHINQLLIDEKNSLTVAKTNSDYKLTKLEEEITLINTLFINTLAAVKHNMIPSNEEILLLLLNSTGKYQSLVNCFNENKQYLLKLLFDINNSNTNNFVIQNFDFSGTSTKYIQSIFDVLKLQNQIEHIYFKQCSMSMREIELFSSAIPYLTNLSVLYLSYNYIDDETVQILSPQLTILHSLQALFISNRYPSAKKIGDNGLIRLVDSLKYFERFTTLVLSNNNFGNKGLSYLKYLSHLNQLLIGGNNNIGDNEIISLCLSSIHFNQLRSLSLDKTKITNHCLQYILNALPFLPHFRLLDLHFNPQLLDTNEYKRLLKYSPNNHSEIEDYDAGYHYYS